MSEPANLIRILYVDDDPDLNDMVTTFLEGEDDRLRVHTATSADEGLGTIAEVGVDCIVSEYDIPGMDGVEFLEAVRETYPDLPFVLYTDTGSEEVAAAAISAGVTDYLQKDRGTDQHAILANRIRKAVSTQWSATDAEGGRHRLERVLKTVPSCVVQLDREGRFVFANDRAVEVLGLRESELTDRVYNDSEWEITDPDGDPIPDEKLPFRQVRDSGEPLYGFRHTIKSPDGTRKNLLVNGVPLFDTAGEVDSIVFSLTDITEQIEHENRHTQATARLEALFENSPDMINIHDVEGNITDPNPTLCEETGYGKDELTGMKVWELDRTSDPDELRAVWTEMRHGDRERLEGVYKRRDGSELPVEVHVRHLGVDGEKRFMVISRDISERKKQEQQLQQERDRFRAVFEDAFDAMVLADDDGRYIKVNKSAIELFGLPEDELIGRSIRDFTPEEFDFETAWWEFQQSDKGFGTFPLVRSDGDERTIEYAATRDVIPGQHLSVLRDVTEREQREQRLNRQNERLEEFASIVSHDLRNPLNVADGRLKLAREECDSEHLEHAERALARMDALIEDLLTLAREGETADDPEPVDLAATVDGCWVNVETADATLVIDVNRTIHADESRLKQLVENLVRNAVEHGGDTVTVTVGELDDGFYVEDDGPGIPESERDDVFDAGYSTNEAGTGFGLSIVKQVVNAHDWTIRVTEGSKGGARFEVSGVTFSAD